MRKVELPTLVISVIVIVGFVSFWAAILIPLLGQYGRFDSDSLAILAIAVVVMVAIIGRTIVHLETARSRNASMERDPEETQLIQEMHRSLARMEERIEALETLYMDKAREDSFTQRL